MMLYFSCSTVIGSHCSFPPRSFSLIQDLVRFYSEKLKKKENLTCTECSKGSFTMFSSDQIRSVTQLCLTLCDPMNRSTPSLPVPHQLPEFTQTHVHRVSDAIQPSHPLSSPSPPAPIPSQHQSLPMSQLFAWGGQSTRVSALASFLPKNSQGWSPSEWTGWISLQSKGLSRVFSNTTYKQLKTWITSV